MNLVFSYSSDEDKKLDAAGFTFLGAARDSHGSEVHVFQLVSLDDARQPEGDAAIGSATEKAQSLVRHALSASGAEQEREPIPAMELVDKLIDVIAPIRGDAAVVLKSALDQVVCLKMIHKALDGNEWDSSTTDAISEMLREVGFEIRDSDDCGDLEEE